MKFKSLFCFICILLCVLSCYRKSKSYIKFEGIQNQESCEIKDQMLNHHVIPNLLYNDGIKTSLIFYHCLLIKIVTTYCDSDINSGLAKNFSQKVIGKAITMSEDSNIFCYVDHLQYDSIYGYFLVKALFAIEDDNYMVMGRKGNLPRAFCEGMSSDLVYLPYGLSKYIMQLTFLKSNKGEKDKVYYQFFD